MRVEPFRKDAKCGPVVAKTKLRVPTQVIMMSATFVRSRNRAHRNLQCKTLRGRAWVLHCYFCCLFFIGRRPRPAV